MCLAVPAKIVNIEGTRALLDMAGNETEADISLVADVMIGDYVIVHAGLAIQRYDREEAIKTLELFSRLKEHMEVS